MAIWHVAPLRFIPEFRALGLCEHSRQRYNNNSDKICRDHTYKIGTTLSKEKSLGTTLSQEYLFLDFLVKVLARFLPRNPRISKMLQDRVKKFKRWTDKSEWKQTKIDANCSLVSVPSMSQLFALPTKLSRSEIHYFVLSYIQYSKEW